MRHITRANALFSGHIKSRLRCEITQKSTVFLYKGARRWQIMQIKKKYTSSVSNGNKQHAEQVTYLLCFCHVLKKFKLTAFSYKIPSKSPALQAQNKRNVPFRSNVFLRNNGMFTRKSHLPLETAARFKVRILLKKCRLPLKSTTNFSRASRCKNKQYSVKKVPFFQVALLKRKGQCSFHPCKKVHNVASAARRHFFQMCGSFFQKT